MNSKLFRSGTRERSVLGHWGWGKKMISRRDAKPPREEEEEFLTTENAKSTEGKRSGIDHEIHGNHEKGRIAAH